MAVLLEHVVDLDFDFDFPGRQPTVLILKFTVAGHGGLAVAVFVLPICHDFDQLRFGYAVDDLLAAFRSPRRHFPLGWGDHFESFIRCRSIARSVGFLLGGRLGMGVYRGIVAGFE